MPGEQRTVLVVDDDPKVRLLLRRCLESDGYQVLEAANKEAIDVCLARMHVDLITLDINLGTESGLSIAAALRASSNIPIIMVTGQGDVVDKVVGLEIGADDYIAKPFHVREVLARVRSVIRRSEAGSTSTDLGSPGKIADSDVFRFSGWQADFSRYELKDPRGNDCELTTGDFKLLMVFLQHPKKVLSRDRIMNFLNGHDWSPYDRTIDNQVARLRKKIEKDPANPAVIKTVRGVGYIFAEDVETG